MKANLSDAVIDYHPITQSQYPVPAGAAGWVETDVSATTGINTHRTWLVHITGIGVTLGIRSHGEIAEPYQYIISSSLGLTKVNNVGHVDLYRDAAVAANYTFIGYFA